MGAGDFKYLAGAAGAEAARAKGALLEFKIQGLGWESRSSAARVKRALRKAAAAAERVRAAVCAGAMGVSAASTVAVCGSGLGF